MKAFKYLDERQIFYDANSNYIQLNQKHLTWKMRAMLMEWMTQLAHEFKMTRESLYLAISIVDRFFSSTTDLSKADFQLTGATALFISSKIDLLQPISS